MTRVLRPRIAAERSSHSIGAPIIASPQRSRVALPAGLVPPPSFGPEQTIRWLAGRQHDVVSRRQLLAAGLSPDQVTDRVRRGVLTRIHRGVFTLSSRPLPPHGRFAAAVLAGPDDTVLSHRSAAQLHGMLPQDRGPVHVTTAEISRSRLGIVIHRSRCLEDATTTREGIACTTIPRTLVDLAAQLGPVPAERAWSTLGARRAIDLNAVENELRRHPNRPGSSVVRALVATHHDTISGVSRSTLETMAIALCRKHGLPMPQVNALLTIGTRTFEIDLLWRGAKIAVEVDSWGTHGHVSSFRNDRARDFTLQAAGWAVVRLLRADLDANAPATAAKLRTLLDRRAGSSR